MGYCGFSRFFLTFQQSYFKMIRVLRQPLFIQAAVLQEGLQFDAEGQTHSDGGRG